MEASPPINSITSIASSRKIGNGPEDELRDCLLHIIRKNIPDEEKAEKILNLFTTFEPSPILERDETENIIPKRGTCKPFMVEQYLQTTPRPFDAHKSAVSNLLADILSAYTDVGPFMTPEASTEPPLDALHVINSSAPNPQVNVAEVPVPTVPEAAALDNNRSGTGQRFSSLKESPGESSSDISTLSEESESSSEAACPTDLSGLILGDKGNEFSRKLWTYFSTLIDSRLGITQCASGQAPDKNDPSSFSSKLLRTTGHSSSEPRSKRSRGVEGEGDENPDTPGDGNGNDDPSKKRPKTGGPEARRIACPFLKRNPLLFSTWSPCVGPGFENINRMKEHLKRKHFKQRCCRRCGQQFETGQLLEDHTLAEAPCAVVENCVADGFMTPFQWDEIHRIKSSKGPASLEKWRDIYLILFPDVDESVIPGPYFDLSEVSNAIQQQINPYDCKWHLMQTLPRRVLARLDKRFDCLAEQLKNWLAEIIREEISDILKNYVLQEGIEPSSQPAGQCPAEGELINDDVLDFGDGHLDGFDLPTQNERSTEPPIDSTQDDLSNFNKWLNENIGPAGFEGDWNVVDFNNPARDC
ncbi:hypothetical protein F4777DRAFT_510913 [Nemania sp. FL0916]|nr:hypothetical protein F4777DRAFT_510913 [Nemania sp. FL0916]